mgnify:CR=1 FL=1
MPSYLRLLTEKSSNIPTPPTGHTGLYASSGTAGESQYQLYIKDPTGQSVPVGGFSSGGTFSGNVTFMSGGTFYSGGYATSGTDTTALVVYGDISGATSGTCYFNNYSSSSPLGIQAGTAGVNDNIYLQPDFTEGMDKNVAIHVPFSSGTYSSGGNYYAMLEHSLTISGATSGTSSIGYGKENTFNLAAAESGDYAYGHNTHAVFGSGNKVLGQNNFVAGSGNTATTDAASCTIFGSGNTITGVRNIGNFVANGNGVGTGYLGIGGQEQGNKIWKRTKGSAAFGGRNEIGMGVGGGMNNAFVAGQHNRATGQTLNSPTTVFGRYNAWSTLLTVGAGSGSTTGTNASANAGRVNVMSVTESGATFGRHYIPYGGSGALVANPNSLDGSKKIALGVMSGAGQTAATGQHTAQGFHPGLHQPSGVTENQFSLGYFGNGSNQGGMSETIPEGLMAYCQYSKTLAIWTGGTAWARVALSALT